MNKLTIIGNLVRETELRTTQDGTSVCSFTVAVNRKKDKEHPDYFRVSAWRQLGENCSKYLSKGSKVCVIGPVTVRTYETSKGEHGASMEVTADEVEFLSSRNTDPQTGYEKVEPSDLPY